MYKPIKEPWNDIKEIESHKQIHHNRIKQQTVFFQGTDLQQIRFLLYWIFTNALIPIT
jgi:hypothetical protein